MSFSISKDELIQIVTKCQQRTFAEEVQYFAGKPSPVEWLSSGVNTSCPNGIVGDAEDLSERVAFYGNNEKPVNEPPGFCRLMWEAMQDFILRILLVAALVLIVLQIAVATPQKRSTAWIQGAAILTAVFIVSFVTAANDYSKQRQFKQLNQVADSRKRVSIKRNGQLMQIHQDKVLVGDVIQLSEGMEIPADGILIQANQISADQSAMTGQTDPIKKNTINVCIEKMNEIIANGQKNSAGLHDVPTPVMLSGTRMLTGEGRMIVIVVGDSSCLGKIRALLEQDQETSTPLQNKLEMIAEDIGKFGLVASITIFLVLIIRFGVEKAINPSWDHSVDWGKLLHHFVLALTVLVVAIPQGLPLAVTLSLAFSVKKMLVDNNLVRKMEACETMGGANNICSDKTGTLTLNKMTFTTYWNGQIKEYDNFKEQIDINDHFPNKDYQNLYALSCCVNSSALLRPEVKGSSTEVAILNLIEKMGYNYETLRQENPAVIKFPFNSKRKRMSVVLKQDDIQLIFLKGASQIVLAACNQWMCGKTGKINKIDETTKETMEKSIVTMAEGSLRTLCLAYKIKGLTENYLNSDEKGVFDIQKDNFVLLSIIGVKDIPRPQVPEAIRKCKRAGIKVRMVTGDNIVTAKAIAKEVGIIEPGNDDIIVMEGAEFIKLIGGVVCKNCQTQLCDCPRNNKDLEAGKELRVDTIKNGEQFDRIVEKLVVLARSRPQDKYALVTGLKQRDNVVAVTGDGTNDAPALKKADVGFAMGINGTQVARQASAIILLDDNFNSIVKAVLWGRNIYDSIRKFIQFQITVNCVAVTITLVGAAVLKQDILKPIQLLWLNLIMDTLGSLALATENPTEDLLDRKPHTRDDYIISKTMFKHIIGQAIFMFIMLVILVFLGDQFIPEYADAYDQTAGFKSEYKYSATGTVRSGRSIFVNGDPDYEKVLQATGIYSRHFTFIFTAFVMMQVFNFVNCRKIHDELNIFEGILSNYFFGGVIVVIFCLQLLLITFAGPAFSVYGYWGLHPLQWLICIFIGSLTWPLNIFLKMLPIDKKMPQAGQKEVDLPRRNSKIMSLKRVDQRMHRDLSHNHINN